MTTERLLCVGGVADGLIVEVQDGQMFTQMWTPLKSPFAWAGAVDPDVPETEIRVRVDGYTRRVFCSESGDTHLMAVTNMSDAQVMRALIEGYPRDH